MSFFAYNGVSDGVLDEVHETSSGEHYTLRHNSALKVEMQYLGKGKNNANSQGWERNSDKYFNELLKEHPEMFSAKNVQRIQQKNAPIVDQKMIDHNPQWAEYRNQHLVHHHIGGDGEAVAVPKNMHKGSGEIHNHEKAAGITDQCKEFSNKCGHMGDAEGKTASELHSESSNQHSTNCETDNNERVDSVHSAVEKNENNSAQERIDSVTKATSTSESQESRTAAVETTSQSSLNNSQNAASSESKASGNGEAQGK